MQLLKHHHIIKQKLRRQIRTPVGHTRSPNEFLFCYLAYFIDCDVHLLQVKIYCKTCQCVES